MRRSVVPVLALLVLAACSSTPPGPEQSGARVEDRRPSSDSMAVDPSSVATREAGRSGNAAAYPELRDPKNILSKRSVYFDFDQYVVKSDYQSLVEAHAKFLTQHQDMKMLIQGNTDERGSREYNLALGQKRADAVKRALTALGAKESQVESVSLGEEKPKGSGHDEASWAENRRGDMLYSGEF